MRKFLNKDVINKVFNFIYVILGIICLIYYITCGLINGFSTSILWVWLIFGGIILVKGITDIWFVKNDILKDNKVYKVFSVIFGVIFTIIFILVAVFEISVISSINKRTNKELDYIIILGAKVNGDKPSDVLKSRIDVAYSYLKDNLDTKVVVTGGMGTNESISEASCMSNELERMGIDKDRIIIEDKATTTAENFKFSLELIPMDVSNIGIVTSGFHMFRSKKTAETIDECNRNFECLTSEFGGIMLPHFMLRELATYVVDSYLGNIR